VWLFQLKVAATMVDTLNDTSEPTLKASAMEALKWGSRRIISSYIFDYLTIV